MALGSLLAINVADVLKDCKVLKQKLAEMYPDVDDRICENYGILLAMAGKVSKNYKVMKHLNFLIGCLKEIDIECELQTTHEMGIIIFS